MNALRFSTAHSAEVSAIAHATEDINKVELAIRNLLPERIRHTIRLSRQYATGHHGNPIVVITAKIKEQESFEIFASFLARSMSDTEKLDFEMHLAERIDPEGNLFLRLDKQEAFAGNLRLREDDPIRVRLKVANKGEPIGSVRQTLRSLEFLG